MSTANKTIQRLICYPSQGCSEGAATAVPKKFLQTVGQEPDPYRDKPRRYHVLVNYGLKPIAWRESTSPFSEHPHNGLTKEWHGLNCPEVFKTPRPKKMLFDLQVDPLERYNLVSDQKHEATLNELRASLERWMEETDDPIRLGHVRPPKGSRVTPAKVWGPKESVTDQFDPETD